MANYKNNRQQNDKAARKPKPIKITLALEVSGKYADTSYDAESVYTMVSELADQKVFDMLSITVSLSKSYIYADGKGTVQAARITGYDRANRTVDLLFFGKNRQYGELINDEDWIVIPKVLVNRSTSAASTILGFELVKEADT